MENKNENEKKKKMKETDFFKKYFVFLSGPKLPQGFTYNGIERSTCCTL